MYGRTLVIKKLAATGVLGFAITASALAAAPAAYAGGWDGHHGKKHDGGSFSNNKTSGNFSILGGTQVIAPISVPVNVCGNAVAVLGNAGAGCKGGAEVDFD
ncbi:chaplin family protein [Actinomadura sediminis]|uniref:Chaplin family protein n=1 Tax=Actinomadura sediminis TaxID=1038904 RepID=A0ABW3EEM3_9ACTN